MKTIIAGIIVMLFPANAVWGQTSSLYATPTTRMEARVPLRLNSTSYIAREVTPRREFKEQDPIMVIVRDQFRNDNLANAERKREMESSYGITSWVNFNGLSFTPAPMNEGSPTIAGEIDSEFKNKGKIIQKQLTEFKISCRVVSICDNGLLYIEGTNKKVVGDDESTMDFSGFVRQEDILPDNSVLSERVLDYSIVVRHGGNVYDGIRRNWGQKLIDRWSPF